MVLRWRERYNGVSITECQNAQFVSLEEFLNDNFVAYP